MQTFARWVSTPETEAARLAAELVADRVAMGRIRRETNPLFLHGLSGCGKTHLVAALIHELATRLPEAIVKLVPAREFAGDQRAPSLPGRSDSGDDCDLLAVEDVQHLPGRAAERLGQIIDERIAGRKQTICTATMGPAQLTRLPARLTSRLASGLVVGLTPLGPASRLAFLQDCTERRQVPISRDVLAWLAKHLPGSARQLEGAVGRLQTLVRLHDRIPTPDLVAEHFRIDVESSRPTVERIAERVSRHFQVQPSVLQSKRRSRGTLAARQVAMALARRLTPLSLEQIGAYFGGRDHSTVLHACRKVESGRDALLTGALRQLHTELA
jgi:chromosomal replication initiator protein